MHMAKQNRTKTNEIVIPPGTKEIRDYAFNERDKMTSVVIPDSVKEIAGWAFDGCTSLAEVEIPPNTKVDPYAFCRSTKKRRKE